MVEKRIKDLMSTGEIRSSTISSTIGQWMKCFLQMQKMSEYRALLEEEGQFRQHRRNYTENQYEPEDSARQR